MENKLQKRFGLFTAICMVVGIVIGSGVFFKAQDILKYAGGNMPLGILAWLIGGVIMIVCALTFANFATKYEKVNGIVDYCEAIVGKKYAYMMGWFLCTIYYPGMTSVLAWVSARYTLYLFGSTDMTGGLCMALGAFYLVVVYALNSLSPILAGKFQVSSTVIKMVPLTVMIVVGIIAGIANGNLSDAVAGGSAGLGEGGISSVFAGVVAAAFAYEGWIIATSINSEMKNSKKQLPIALVVGTAIIMAVYILYYIGLAGGASVDTIMTGGSEAVFKNLFGNVAGTVLNAFVVVSCLGTLNGLMVASTRGFYSIAARNQGPRPEMLHAVDSHSGMPTNSGIVGVAICVVWYFYFYGANLTNPIFGLFSFDSSELPIVTIYGMYIPVFIAYIRKEWRGENKVKNVLFPVLAMIASLFMVFCACYAHGYVKYMAAKEAGEFSCPVLFYMIVFAVVMLAGLFFYKKGRNTEE